MNGVIALIFVFFSPSSIALQADYVTVVEYRSIMSVKYCNPVPFFHFWPKLERGLFAIAEYLIYSYDRHAPFPGLDVVRLNHNAQDLGMNTE